MKIYIDHNILDALSKHHFKMNAPEDTVWIYSHETFNEIKRAGDLRFLDMLRDLKARKLELVLDSKFKITGEAYIHEYREPQEFYQLWLEAIAQCPIDEQIHLQFLNRLAGGNNHNEILLHPDRLKDQIRALLEPHGMFTAEIETEVESIAADIQNIVQGPMQRIQELEHSRGQIGTGKGRAGNASSDSNPIQSLWLLIQNNYVDITIDQYFGFDPIDKQGYENWPLYLGIIGCHTILNFLGFHADRGLNNIDKIPGIMSDANHTAMAIYCDAIISKDKKFCAKARAIYTYLGLDIQVLEIS